MSKTPFCATSEQDQALMFKTLGIESFDDLFAAIPDHLRAESVNIPDGMSEMEMMQHLRRVASKNASHLVNFCGAGFYDHYIPAAVNALASRGEFYTAYTPYQPEASQGTLQAAFEYQTAICRLTGMEVANASLFPGEWFLYHHAVEEKRHGGTVEASVAANFSTSGHWHVHPRSFELDGKYLRWFA